MNNYTEIVAGNVNNIQLSGWLVKPVQRVNYDSGASCLKSRIKFYQPSRRGGEWAQVNIKLWVHKDNRQDVSHALQLKEGDEVVVEGKLSIHDFGGRPYTQIVASRLG